MVPGSLLYLGSIWAVSVVSQTCAMSEQVAGSRSRNLLSSHCCSLQDAVSHLQRLYYCLARGARQVVAPVSNVTRPCNHPPGHDIVIILAEPGSRRRHAGLVIPVCRLPWSVEEQPHCIVMLLCVLKTHTIGGCLSWTVASDQLPCVVQLRQHGRRQPSLFGI